MTIDYTNPAIVGLLVVLVAFYGIFGWATAKDNGRPNASVIIAVFGAVIGSAYALLVEHSPFTLCTIGVLAVVHLFTAVRLPRKTQQPPQAETQEDKAT